MNLQTVFSFAIILLFLCGGAGSGLESTAIAKKNDPIQSKSAWGPKDEIKAQRELRRSAKKAASLKKEEAELYKVEREISTLKQKQTAELRKISQLKKRIRQISESRKAQLRQAPGQAPK